MNELFRKKKTVFLKYPKFFIPECTKKNCKIKLEANEEVGLLYRSLLGYFRAVFAINCVKRENGTSAMHSAPGA